jgi:hypothetical protein
MSDQQTCPADYWRPAFGKTVRGCVLAAGHEGPHRDHAGNEWGVLHGGHSRWLRSPREQDPLQALHEIDTEGL